jgi:outer membrane protein TolC
VLVVALTSAGCAIGPKYVRPEIAVPAAYREAPPDGWREAQPNDAATRGRWWQLLNEPGLDALEERVSISNQNVLAAEAHYRAARRGCAGGRGRPLPHGGGDAVVHEVG